MDNNIHVNDVDENIEENLDQNLDGENITITFSNGDINEDSPFSIIREQRENNEEETKEDELQNEVQESIKEEDIEKIFETTNKDNKENGNNSNNSNNGEQSDLVPKPRKYQDEDVSHPNWPKHKKHVFILSNAGKPIYARYGDESKLAPFMGVLQAIVSFVDDLDDEMRCILAGEHKIVFLVKGPLYFAIVAKSTESEKILEKQLEYVYYQIIALLTTGINKIYETKSHFDLRGLLGGAEKFMDSLIHSMDYLPQFLLASVHCLRLPKAVRSSVGSLIKSSYTKDLIFALLISNNRLIHLVRPKKHILHPLDLHLIFNFVNNSVSFRSSESWTPLCLPHFNDKGFLHCFICFITPEICCLLISTKPEKFYEMRETKNLIQQKLEETNSLEELNKAALNSEYRISDINQPVPHLLHFLYKSQNTSQFTSPAFTSPYHQKKHQKRLFRLYQHVYQRMRSTNEEERIWFHISSYESILGWIGVGFELYATFGPLITKKTAIKVSNSLLMWIKRNEEDLFILNSPVW